VGTVTRADLQSWITELTAGGLAPATVQHHYVALQKAMQFAQQDRPIAHNPCGGVKLPKSHKADGFAPVFLSARQVEALAAKLDEVAPYGLLLRFAAYTGLRAAELTALRVRDLNLKAGHVEVRRTLQRISGEWTVGTPKSARSSRNVPLVNRALVAELREYLLEHPCSGDSDTLLWPGRTVGSHALDWSRMFDGGSFQRNYFRPALRAAGLGEMRFHDLRHTFASLILAAGFAPFEVSRWLGHGT
jgi:integrase